MGKVNFLKLSDMTCHETFPWDIGTTWRFFFLQIQGWTVPHNLSGVLLDLHFEYISENEGYAFLWRLVYMYIQWHKGNLLQSYASGQLKTINTFNHTVYYNMGNSVCQYVYWAFNFCGVYLIIIMF